MPLLGLGPFGGMLGGPPSMGPPGSPAVGYGLVGVIDEYRQKIVVTGSGNGIGNPQWSAGAVSINTSFDSPGIAPLFVSGTLLSGQVHPYHQGINMSVEGRLVGGVVYNRYIVAIPAIPVLIGTSLEWDVTGGANPATFEVVVSGYRLYNTGLKWYCTIDRIEVFVEGSSVHVWTNVVLPTGLQPLPYVVASSMPLFGGGVMMTVGTGVSPATVQGGPFVGKGSTASATIGASLKINGAYVTVPVVPSPGTGVGGTTLDSITLSASHSESGSLDTSSNWIWACPGFGRGVIRMNGDYEGVIFGEGFDQWGVSDDTQTIPQNTLHGGSVPPTYTHSFTSYLSKQDPQSGVVTNTAHVMESPFAATPYSPSAWAHNTETAADGSGDYTDFAEQIYWDSGTLAVRPGWSPTPYAWAANQYADKYARYYNTWIAPHWSFCLHYPSDLDTLPYAWPVNGSAATPAAYWAPAGQQWAGDATLPSGDVTNRRVDVVAEPLVNSPTWAGQCLADFHIKTSFWGVSRFAVFPLAAAPVTTPGNSAARWTATGGSVAPNGTGLTLGAGVTALEYTLQDSSSPPYDVPAWAKTMAATWVGLTHVNVYLVGNDGTKVLMGTAPGTLAIPSGATARWDGSWAQDFGQGLVLPSDTYLSLAVASDGTEIPLQGQLALGPGRSGIKVRFEFDATAGGEVVGKLTFNPPPMTGAIGFTTSGRNYEVLFPNASYLRAGVIGYSPGGGAGVSGSLTGKPQLGEMLCWANSWWNGSPPTTGILLLAQVMGFDPVYEAGVASDLWSGFSAFTLPTSTGFAVAGVYGLREVPPLPMLPRKKRDADYGEAGAYGLWAYSWIARDRNVVHPGSPLTLNVGGSNVLTPKTAPAGWTVGAWAPATTGGEGYDDTLRLGSTDYLKVRPWRGFFAILASGSPQGVWNAHSKLGEYHKGVLNSDGSITHYYTNVSYPPFINSYNWGGGYTDAKFCIIPGKSNSVAYVLTGDTGVNLVEAYDDGATVSAPVNYYDNTYMHGDCTSNNHGYLLVSASKYVSGTSGPVYIYVSRRNIDGTVDGPFQVKDTGGTAIQFADATFHVSASPDGNWVLAAIKYGYADATDYLSTDEGGTWAPL